MKREIGRFIASRERDHRYASWDYCFAYFRANSGHLSEDMEKSCAILGFYLASWGMLRNSPLLDKSYLHYWRLIEYIDREDTDDRTFIALDVPKYKLQFTRDRILERAEEVRNLLRVDGERDSLTRTTKAMLGIWGNVPAFDRYFKAALGESAGRRSYTKLNDRALEEIYRLYAKTNNRRYLDDVDIRTIPFRGSKRRFRYPIAKLIDMYGFRRGALLLGEDID